MEYAIETFSLTKVFSDWWGRDKVFAVDDLNLRVHYNEVFGLLGPNGSGKTTTLKMLLGLLYPTKGRAVVLGGDGAEPRISARIGFMPEESYLYRYLNARETLDFYGSLFGLPGNVRKIRIEALLEMVGLKAVANRPVGTYSKGMARRIGLAQALINDPDLLILDEPTTGLDPIGTRQIKDLIVELSKRGKTILLCSHLLADVEDVCDRIAILYGGKIQTEGQVKDLLLQTNKRQITTGVLSEATVEKIKQLVLEEDSTCEVSSPMDKLETYFIKTVAAAEKESRPTSGAVGAAGISDFLTARGAAENVLDKLVSAPVSQEPSTPEPATTEKVVSAEASKAEPDEQVLQELTEPKASGGPSPVAGDEEAETPLLRFAKQNGGVEQKAPEEEQVKKDILESLTGPMEERAGDKDREHNDRSGPAAEGEADQAGERGDA